MGKLVERLNQGTILCAEGYLFELERRGYLQAGAFVPEVVLDYPEVVTQLHRDFLRAGSDVMVAFTYYAHREKMRLIGKEHLIEPLQKNALNLARKVADEDPKNQVLVAGNICNTNIYDPNDKNTHKEIRTMFEEQVGWAKEADVDFILLETLSWFGEAMIGLEVCKAFDMEVVVNIISHSTGLLRDELTPVDCCKKLEDAGADVVGMNCNRGPATMLPTIKEIRKAVNCHVAALPVPYRTTETNPTFQSLEDPVGHHCLPEGHRSFPVALDPFTCTRYEMGEFAQECAKEDIRFIGICCGGAPHHVRSMAEALGKEAQASEYTADMNKHFALGNAAPLKELNQNFKQNL